MEIDDRGFDSRTPADGAPAWANLADRRFFRKSEFRPSIGGAQPAAVCKRGGGGSALGPHAADCAPARGMAWFDFVDAQAPHHVGSRVPGLWRLDRVHPRRGGARNET